jgi:hypothetical protein
MAGLSITNLSAALCRGACMCLLSGLVSSVWAGFEQPDGAVLNLLRPALAAQAAQAPTAPLRCVIGIARLDNDADGSRRKALAAALQRYFNKDGMQVLLPDAPVVRIDPSDGAPQQARQLRERMGAAVLIWGRASVDPGSGLSSLHWSVGGSAGAVGPADADWASGADVDLPEMTLTDATALLKLLGALQTLGAPWSPARGLADEIAPLVPQLERLLGAEALSTPEAMRLHWLLATSLAAYGGQAGDDHALSLAIQAYRTLLQGAGFGQGQGRPRALTQHSLGLALLTLGARQHSEALLAESVRAFQDALKERRRERVPLDWAASREGQGDALLALGQLDDEPTPLTQAVAAYRDALTERTRERPSSTPKRSFQPFLQSGSNQINNLALQF